MKHTLLIGTDFKRSSLKMREMVHFDDHIKPEVISKLKTGIKDIEECVILTTCNRIEIYIVCSCPSRTSKYVLNFLSRMHKVPVTILKEHMYRKRCADVVRHIFRVASGLESMVIGEAQILGQIKKDYELSKKCGGTGPFLNKLFQNALALGKKVRSETLVSSGITSIGSAAAKLALKDCEKKKRHFAVIGCGEMGSIVARHLSKEKGNSLSVINRTDTTSKKLAKEIGATPLPYKNLERLLGEADTLITATSSDTYVISMNQHSGQIKNRDNITIIDIAIPRSVDPRIENLPNVTLYTIDSLKEIVDQNLQIRQEAMDVIETFIENKLGFYRKWYEYKSGYHEEIKNWQPNFPFGTGPNEYCQDEA